MATVLAGHSDRVRALFGEAAAIENDHRVGLPQVLSHQPLQPPQNRVVLPGTFAQKLLDRAHRGSIGAVQRQHHRLNGLTLKVRELAAQVELAPFALLTAAKQVVKLGMVSDQLFGHDFNVVGREGRLWLPTTRRWLVARDMRPRLNFTTHWSPPKLVIRRMYQISHVSL
jgi:hypothetical protein